MEAFVAKHNLEAPQFLDFETWVVILILSVLVGLIVVGIALIYIYYQKMILLLRQQQSFINGFTHELKTPVASLKLFLETFSKHDLPREKFLKYVEMMKKDTDRLSDNIQQILQLAKLEDKKSREEFVEVFPEQFINEFVQKKMSSFEKGEVVVHFSKIGDYGKIMINQTLFEMLIMNLISNGLIYNKNSNPCVEIKFKKRYRYVDILFIDNGIGIEKSQMKKIFKKYYQVNATGKGSGIGLYMARLVAKLHKGDIKVTSGEYGSGSVFTLILPLVRS